MPKDPETSHALFASDLLGFPNEVNAVTLNGYNADQFFKTELKDGPDSELNAPIYDLGVDLGAPTQRIRRIYATELRGLTTINGLPFDVYMRVDKTNVPSEDNKWDLGSSAKAWRSIYGKEGHFDKLYVNELLTPNGTKFSHYDLATDSIGTYKHSQIDAHINTRNTIGAAAANVHGATHENIARTIVSRDGSGNIWVNELFGIATKARWADLAEKYTTEEKAKVGTVYCVSTNEKYDVEICKEENCVKVVGVVSETPGFVMNSAIDGVILGLKGKLKIRVIGPVKKGDILVSSKLPGVAMASNMLNVTFKIGLANETNESAEEKLIEAIL